MQDDQQKKLEAQQSLESSLESQQAVNPVDLATTPPTQTTSQPKKARGSFNIFGSHWSIYLPVFLVFIIAVSIGSYYLYNKQNKQPTIPSEQNLTSSQLNNLASGNNVIGNSNQILTVQSSSIFNGQVLIRGQLQVAGNLQIAQLNVSNSLALAGNGTVQGTLTVQNNLSVKGTGTFSGNVTTPQLTTNSLQLNSDLSITHHIVTTGSIPTSTTASEVGSGGTSSINGTDTSGTITINTGNSPTAGCYINVSFSSRYSSTPHVLLTPVGATSSTINYYVNRSSSGFSVCSSNAPQPSQTYTYDYFSID